MCLYFHLALEGASLCYAHTNVSSNCLFCALQIGLDWADKKSICNKFGHTSPITCLCWPAGTGGDLIFGAADGKVRIGQLKVNKPATLFSSESYVISLATSANGNAVISGHLDGSVYVTLLDDFASAGTVSATKLFTHSCPPAALAWGSAIVAAGSDGRVCFYDHDGGLVRTFDYNGDSAVKDFTCAVANPTGEAVVVGNFNRFHVYALEAPAASGGTTSITSTAPHEWKEASIKVVDGMYTVTALAWKPDGSKLAVGSLCGAVDLFDACLRRVRYKGKFEFTYVSPSTVIVKRLSSGTRIVLRSSFGYEITRIKVYRDRFLIANTCRTLLAGDLESCRLSEVPWVDSGASLSPSAAPGGKGAGGASRSKSGAGGDGGGIDPSGRERTRYYLENPSVALVYRAGELTVVEYGKTEILSSCRTEYLSPHTVSVRLFEKPASASGATGPVTLKVMSYLLDAHTVRVVDLTSGATLATIDHDSRVDWLELNARGTLLLFRDVRHRLHLYDIPRQARSTLLPFCNYAQWVPDSDVVVAQRRNTLCVWYNIRAPERVTSYEIKGDVEEIVRGGGKSEVIVDEGMATASYLLDEGLIAFGGAMDDCDFGSAVATLEGLEYTPETGGMWALLGEAALAARDLPVAERCAIALGDVARARYLHKVCIPLASCMCREAHAPHTYIQAPKHLPRTHCSSRILHESCVFMCLQTAKIAGVAGSRLGGDGRDYWMVRARLAQQRKDIVGAESIFLEQGKVEEAVKMYQVRTPSRSL